MKLRIALGVAAALGTLAACSGSAAKTEATEETQAAYVLMGMLDKMTAIGTWIEQTATSPAAFSLHDNDDTVVITATVSKVGSCQYQLGLQDNEGHFELVRDLSKADPDKVTPGNNNGIVVMPGMTGSCKVVSGRPDACNTLKADETKVLFGVSLAHERASLKTFKAKYCQ